jgi:hypothetical protein
MNDVKDAEKTQTEQATPAPATETPKVTQTPVVDAKSDSVKPVEATTESNKQTAAFVKMRQELRELKRKAATATPTPSPAATTETEVKPPTTKANPAPAPKAEVDIEAESVKAIQSIGNDPELVKLPGAIIDLCEMVDSDPRLARLHDIDPTLAFREAKAIYLSKAGINTPPPVPKPTSVSGGIPPGKKDLNALLAEAEKLPPGTREHSRIVDEINREMKKLR